MSEKTRLQRLEQGICTDCGGELHKDVKRFATGSLKRMCRKCLGKNAVKQERYREEAYAKGLCTRCKRQPFRKGKRICQNCADYATKKCKIRRDKTFFEKKVLNMMGRGERTIGNAKMLWSIWKTQRGRCALTGIRLTRTNCEIDHIVPISKGGNNSRNNLQWLLADVNQAKRALSDCDFIELCRAVVKYSDAKANK